VARLITSSALRIAEQVQRFRRKNPAKIWKAIKDGSYPSAWLELQYGWNPLMSDVSGASEALSQRDADSQRYKVHVVGTANRTEKTRSEWHADGVGFPAFCYVDEVLELKAKVRLDYYLEHPALAQFSSLGLTNPALILWELVPYSFVVDWFLPVGNWISAFDADFGWRFRAGTRSTMGKYTRKNSIMMVSDDAGDPRDAITGNSVVGSAKAFAMNRGLYYSSPLPRIPTFKNPFSSAHVANGIALLTNAFDLLGSIRVR